MHGSDRVFMLAGDHRWQWEDWCDAHSVPRARIGDVKAIVADAFLAARQRSADVARSGSLLLDTQYARPQIDRARAADAIVGTPAEKAGAFPLEWGSGDVLVPRADEPEETFEEEGRPAMLARTIRDAYAHGIEPEYWKVEGTTSAAGARTIDRAISERGGSRQITLGKNEGGAMIAKWFSALAGCTTPAGFAIGRSVFWKPGTAFLTGAMSAREAADAMTAGYLALIDAWHAAVSPST